MNVVYVDDTRILCRVPMFMSCHLWTNYLNSIPASCKVGLIVKRCGSKWNSAASSYYRFKYQIPSKCARCTTFGGETCGWSDSYNLPIMRPFYVTI